MYYVKRYLGPVICVILAIVTFLVSGNFRYEMTDLERRCNTPATALIIDIRTTPEGDQDILVCNYRDSMSTTWTLDLVYFVDHGEYQINQEVPVLFNPTKTNEFVLDTPHPNPPQFLAFRFAAGLFFGVGIAWVIFSLIRRGV